MFYHRYKYGEDMTYILGARCVDGVVLTGDTKVTVDGGADYAYSKKIMVEPLTNIVMGSAGIGGLYKEFQNRIITAVIQIEKRREEGVLPLITTEEEFSVLVSKVIRDMHDDYGEDRSMIIYNLMILCATRIGSEIAQLTTFTGYGFPEPVNGIRAIGHGEPYASLFHKKMWKKDMTMEQTAKLGLFIIKFIEDMKLDKSVGFDKEFLPQVVFIPDIEFPEDFPVRVPLDLPEEEMVRLQEGYAELTKAFPIRELPHDEVNHFINEVGAKVSDFENLFKRGQFKI